MSNVHWFPGHMAKAIRLIEEQVKIVDFVIECRDARAPISTRNPVLDKSIGSKKRLVVLTKKDLCDLEKTQVVIDQLEAEGNEVLLIDTLTQPVKKLIVEKSEIILKDKREREIRRGIRPRPARALIVGVPNVGKSTIINRLTSRKAAMVEDRPGVTQALKLIKLSDTLEIVDTPGVLWKKFESHEMGIICALIGSVKETGYPLTLVTDYARDVLVKIKPEVLKRHYKLEDFDNFFEDIGRYKTFLTAGNEVEIDKTRRHFLQDIQRGDLGRITWD